MDVPHLAAVDQHGAVVEHSLGVLLDHAEDHRELAGGRGQAADRGGVDRQRHPPGEVQQPVAGERQLGKDQQLDALAAGALDELQMALQVGLDLPQTAVHLRQSQLEKSAHLSC